MFENENLITVYDVELVRYLKDNGYQCSYIDRNIKGGWIYNWTQDLDRLVILFYRAKNAGRK